MRSYLLFFLTLVLLCTSNVTKAEPKIISLHFNHLDEAFAACIKTSQDLGYAHMSSFDCNEGKPTGMLRFGLAWVCEGGHQDHDFIFGRCRSDLFHSYDRTAYRFHYPCPSPSKAVNKGGAWSWACVVTCPEDKPDYDEELGCIGEKDKKDPNTCPALNPIFPDSGEKYQAQKPDYLGGGSFPLKLSFNYKSYRAPKIIEPERKYLSDERGTPKEHYISVKSKPLKALHFNYLSPTNFSVAPIGYTQWRHSYQLSLFVKSDDSKVILMRANGDKVYFSNSGNGTTYTPDHLTGDKVVKSGADWLYTNPQGTTETYNSDGQLIQITNQQGLSKSLTYNANGLLLSVTDSGGRTLLFAYDSGNRISTVTTPDNNVITYLYGMHSNLVKVVYPDNTPENTSDNPTTQYSYNHVDNPYALTSQIDENGITYTTWTYDSEGKATGSRNFGGHRDGTIAYVDGNATVTEANGQQRTLTFDSKGRLESVTGGNCGQCSSSDVANYTYDNKNQLTSEIDFNGVETRYEYNERGLQTKRTEAYGTSVARNTSTAWHSELALPISVTTPYHRIRYVYGERGRLESITELDLGPTASPSRVTTYIYNEAGLLISIDGPRSDVTDITTFTYNEKHDLASITDGAGNVTHINSYNANGYPTSITDANEVVITLTYDVRNRLISQSVAGYLTTFEYDNIGQLTKITQPSGAITNYLYNGARLLTQLSDGLGNSINYAYDVMGNVTNIEVKDPQGTLHASQQQVFDGLNRLTSQIDGLNQTTLMSYDAVGNQVSVKTSLLKETKQVYDALNRLSETADAKEGKTTYGYDVAGNLNLVKAPNNAQTAYSYDGLGNLLSQSSPDTGITRFTYDVVGNQITKTDAKGVTVSYRYDVLNRLVSIDYPDDSLDVSLAYDTGINGKGRLTQVTDGSGSTAYSYNVLGKVSGKTSVISGNSFTVSYGYNGSGQLTQMSYPSGRVLNFTRNTHGLITGINELKSGITKDLLTSASYFPFGSAKSFILGNGKATAKTHNLNGQLASIDVNGIYQTSLTYNADSNITGAASAGAANSNQSFIYDELDRLTDATGSYGTLAYSYDAASNRITKTTNSEADSLNYSPTSNKLSVPYMHDVNGNITKDRKRSYSYGEHNRLTEVVNDESGIKTTYLYNGLGQRVKKSNIFGDIYFVYDEQGLLVAEANSAGKVTKEYVYFEGQPLVMLVGE